MPEDEAKAVLKSVSIAATKINDGSYLESEEAYKEYYKPKIEADKATVVTKEINNKKVFFMQYEADGGASGKAIQVNFLGGGSFAVEMKTFEVKKGTQPNYDAMMEAIMPFVEQATQK